MAAHPPARKFPLLARTQAARPLPAPQGNFFRGLACPPIVPGLARGRKQFPESTFRLPAQVRRDGPAGAGLFLAAILSDPGLCWRTLTRDGPVVRRPGRDVPHRLPEIWVAV